MFSQLYLLTNATEQTDYVNFKTLHLIIMPETNLPRQLQTLEKDTSHLRADFYLPSIESTHPPRLSPSIP